MAYLRLLVCWIGGVAAGNDVEALVQKSWSADQSFESSSELSSATRAALDKALKDTNFTLKGVAALAQKHARTLSHIWESGMATGVEASNANTELMAKGWRAFRKLAQQGGGTQPQVLLEHAKTALLQTGALAEMRRVATKAGQGMGIRGGVPLDSMATGFYTSLAPWNNVLKDFSLPLIKARFMLFANFFGPEGSAARLCISADMVLDSTYGAHARSEFGGIGVVVGPTKWDNVAGWKFGAEGGVDDIAILDVADFGWDWTLATMPETVGFRFLVNVIDSEGLHASALQKKAEVLKAAKSEVIPNHGSTYISHTWCSPDWYNTPLVIEDNSLQTKVSKEVPAPAVVQEHKPKEEEDWDPMDDAV